MPTFALTAYQILTACKLSVGVKIGTDYKWESRTENN